MDSSVCCFLPISFFLFVQLVAAVAASAATAALTMCAAMVIYRRKCNKYRMSRLFEQCFSSWIMVFAWTFSVRRLSIHVNFVRCRFVRQNLLSRERARFYMRILKTNVRNVFDVPAWKMHCAQLMPCHAMPCQRIDLSSFRIILFCCLVNRQVNVFFFSFRENKEFKLLRSNFKLFFFTLTLTFQFAASASRRSRYSPLKHFKLKILKIDERTSSTHFRFKFCEHAQTQRTQ